MNEFAVNFASERVDHRYLEILVVGKAIPVKVLCDDLAMRDRFGIGVEIQSNPIPHGDAVFHIEEKFLHGSQPWFQSALVCVVGQPILVPEQNPERHGNLPTLIPLGARRKAAGIAQNGAPFFDEVIEAVKRVIGRCEGSFRHDVPPGFQAGA
jgi:hypothetical protein